MLWWEVRTNIHSFMPQIFNTLYQVLGTQSSIQQTKGDSKSTALCEAVINAMKKNKAGAGGAILFKVMIS